MIPTAICLDAVEEQGLVAEALVPGACHPMRFAQVSKASPVPNFTGAQSAPLGTERLLWDPAGPCNGPTPGQIAEWLPARRQLSEEISGCSE